MNYRTVKLPSDQDVPKFVKAECADSYHAMFTRQVGREGMELVVHGVCLGHGLVRPVRQ